MKFDLNNKRFKVKRNSNGLSNNETIFHYFQNESTIIGDYKGGEILEGLILGKKIDDVNIELMFQCLTKNGDLKIGESKGIISKVNNGKLKIKFDWKWLNGDLTSGESEYVEINKI